MPEFDQAIFKASFERRHKVPVKGGGFVEAVHIIPPESVGLPILVAPGWSNTIALQRHTLEEFYRLGRSVVTLTHARSGIETVTDLPFSTSQVRKADSLASTLDYFGIEKVDIAAHSEGGINGPVMAYEEPWRVRNMVLVGSGGLMAEDNLLGLSSRFMLGEGVALLFGSDRTQKYPPSKIALMLNIAGYISANPRWSLEENVAIAAQRSGDLLQQLRDWGIGISFIHTSGDKVFPAQSLIWDVIDDFTDEDRLGEYYPAKGNHNAILGDPNIVRLAVKALDDLAQKINRQPH